MSNQMQGGYTLRDLLHALFKHKLVIAAFLIGARAWQQSRSRPIVFA